MPSFYLRLALGARSSACALGTGQRDHQPRRGLSDEQKAAAGDDPAPLLLEHPTLIKRPVITDGESVVSVGFDPESLEAFA